jgi:DNA-binding MarR family transcriptional regulator
MASTILGMAEKSDAGAKVGIHEFAGLIFAVSEQTRASFEDVCARFDLTPPQARALLTLAEPAPMRSLADHLRCDASNVTGIADRLEARGLVRRESAESDRRVKLLALTPRGSSARAELEAAVYASSPVWAGLSPTERETLRGLLTKVVRRKGAADADTL